MSALISAQGKSERIENLIRLFTLIPSWWFGHRVTNGVIAKNYDQNLSEKYGVEKGIMVEPQYLHSAAPEPALIQHIFEKTQGQPELREEARDKHAKGMLYGFSLHSAMILIMRLALNGFTKLRATKAVENS